MRILVVEDEQKLAKALKEGLEADDYVRVDRGLVRPSESIPPVGDPSRAEQQLGWKATLSFEQLVHRMVDADLRDLELSARLA